MSKKLIRAMHKSVGSGVGPFWKVFVQVKKTVFVSILQGPMLRIF